MGIVDFNLKFEGAMKKLFPLLVISFLGGTFALIFYIGFVKIPELLWKQEKSIRMMMTQEQLDRLNMEYNHMASYKEMGFVTTYQKLQYEQLPKLIEKKEKVFGELEKATYPEPLVSGSRGGR